ncbi:hypothetical protein GLOIN_2v1123362 [Rhizophagus irregularis DAOM 181602=DAOM 197198]|nr:hypothetical protein GLOIN_2v1123362 [Rhizophagus irregularis DAOM 181602=DAOM 197198]
MKQVYNSESLSPSFISSNMNQIQITISFNSQDNNVQDHVTIAVQDIFNMMIHLKFFHPTIDLQMNFVIIMLIVKKFVDTVTYLLNKSLKENNVQSNENECIFYYKQQHDARFYQVSCEIVSPLLINNCLNKNFLGFELQNSEQEHLVFTINQKREPRILFKTIFKPSFTKLI